MTYFLGGEPGFNDDLLVWGLLSFTLFPSYFVKSESNIVRASLNFRACLLGLGKNSTKYSEGQFVEQLIGSK